MPRNWRDISYLRAGTPKQRRVFDVLTDDGLLKALQEFDATVVSTICVGLDTSTSDIDVICCAPDLSKLESVLQESYSKQQNFQLCSRADTLISSFLLDEFQVEIFASSELVENQNAYRHLSIMERLVSVGGDSFRKDILELKSRGLKTEPAIAQRLGLKGDPYEAVLALKSLPDSSLLEFISGQSGIRD